MSISLRHLRLDKPLCVFDLETTGLDTRTCRAVEVAVLRLDPENDPVCFHSLVNPGMPIPAAARHVHHISDRHVADRPPFRAIARELGTVTAR